MFDRSRSEGAPAPRSGSARPKRRESYPDCSPAATFEGWPADDLVVEAEVHPSEWPAWTDLVPFTIAHPNPDDGSDLPLFDRAEGDS